MKKTLSALLIPGILATSLLAGCNNPQTSNPTPKTQQQTEQTPVTQETAITQQQTSSTLADVLNVQPVFADAAKYYVPTSVTPAIKETGSDPTKAKNLALMQKALATKLSTKQIEFLKKNNFLLLDNFKDVEKFCFQKALLTDPTNCGLPLNDYRLPPDYMTALFSSFAGSGLAGERVPVNAIYVNSDVILHTYHVFFDRYLKKLEEYKLHPLLMSVIDPLQKKTFEDLKTEQNPEAKASLQRVAAYLTVGKVLLETNAGSKSTTYYAEGEDPWVNQDKTVDLSDTTFLKNLEAYKNNFDQDTYQKIQDELKLIVKGDTTATSPLFKNYDPKKTTDYTQFTPRSHYTENSMLRSYFRSMMYFGRQSMPFGSKEGLEDSAVITSLIKEAGIEKEWAKLSDTTDFIAGASDDITFKQFSGAYEKALGTNAILSAVFDPANFEKVKGAASELPAPKILSEIVLDENMANRTKEDLLLETKGFRLFGQKFTFDAWVLNQMTAGAEKTGIQLPSMPTALFVVGAMGSKTVESLLPTWIQKSGQTQLKAGDLWTKLMTIKADLDKMTPQEWLGNISSGWLWTLAPLLQEYGKGYPAFMQSALYINKNLQTALGSYTELKHDTLLYAKQSYAELGGGPGDELPPTEIVKGFVEPDMEFWARMIALTQFTREGLASRGLLDDDVSWRFDGFMENLKFYQTLAQKELTNEKITDDEYEQLRTKFYNISNLIAPFAGEEIQEKDKKTPLIADTHTDGASEQILYEATGNPLVMLAFVSDQGTPRLVIGVAYRHFELTGPLGGTRYTDDEWKAKVDKGDLPETPFYYQDLFVK